MTRWPPQFFKKSYLSVVFLLILLLIVFGPEADKQFLLWDDESLLSQHKPFLPVNLSTFIEIATSPFPAEYIPVTKIVWAMIILPMQFFFGQDWSTQNWVQPFIIAGLLFHFLSALLLKDVFSILFDKTGKVVGWKGWVPVFIFALHPLQVEALASASMIREPMWIFFALLSLRSYLKVELLYSFIFLVLAVLSKPTAVVIPCIILVLHIFKKRAHLYERITLRLYWAAMALLTVLIIFINKSIHKAEDFAPTFGSRIFYTMDSFGFYLKKILFPSELSADYGRTYSSLASAGWSSEITLFILFVVFVLSLYVFLKKERDNILILLSLFLFPLVPVSGLMEFSMQLYSNVADHYAAFSVTALAGVFYLLIEKAKPLPYMGAIICCVFAVKSHQQKRTWQNNQTLAAQILKVNPQSFMAYNNLGIHLLRAGSEADALAQFSESIRLNPTIQNAYLNSAVILTNQRKLAEAASILKAGVSNVPKSSEMRLALAKALEKQGLLAEALDVYESAKLSFPYKGVFPYSLGLLYWKQNDFDQALAELRAASELEPQNRQFSETYKKIEELVKKIKNLR